jgi:uncharacterized membrane protein
MTKQTKSGRPILKIPLQPIDYVLEALGFLSLILMVGLSVYHYNDLPASIPTHFGVDGQPDKTGSKTTIWFLPVLGLVIFGFMTFINRIPHHFNYMVNITPENAERQYTMASRLLRFMKMFIMIIFTFITWRTILIAGGAHEGLGSGSLFLPVLVISLTAYYIYQSVKKQ